MNQNTSGHTLASNLTDKTNKTKTLYPNLQGKT